MVFLGKKDHEGKREARAMQVRQENEVEKVIEVIRANREYLDWTLHVLWAQMVYRCLDADGDR